MLHNRCRQIVASVKDRLRTECQILYCTLLEEQYIYSSSLKCHLNNRVYICYFNIGCFFSKHFTLQDLLSLICDFHWMQLKLKIF